VKWFIGFYGNFTRNEDYFLNLATRLLDTRVIIVFGLAFALLACAPNNPEYENLTQEQIRTLSARDLCEAHFYGQAAAVQNEIMRRNLIDEEDWKNVRNNRVYRGMSECAVRASLGNPSQTKARTSEDFDKILIFDRKKGQTRVFISDNRVQRVERPETTTFS